MEQIANPSAPQSTQQPLPVGLRHRRPTATSPRFAFSWTGEHTTMGPGHYLMLLRARHGQQSRVPVRFKNRVGSY